MILPSYLYISHQITSIKGRQTKRNPISDQITKYPPILIRLSWLGNMYCLADHQAAMKNEEQHDRMEFECSALGYNSQR